MINQNHGTIHGGIRRDFLQENSMYNKTRSFQVVDRIMFLM